MPAVRRVKQTYTQKQWPNFIKESLSGPVEPLHKIFILRKLVKLTDTSIEQVFNPP